MNHSILEVLFGRLVIFQLYSQNFMLLIKVFRNHHTI